MGMKDAPDTETNADKALAEVMLSRFQRYQDVFAPMENQFIRDAFLMRSPGQYGEVAGQASAAFQPQFDQARDTLGANLVARGIDPSSGAYRGASRALDRAQQRAMGQGIAGALVGQTDRGFSAVQNVVALGQNQATDAVQSMGQATAQLNAQAESQAQAGLSRAIAPLEIAGAATGVGVGLYQNRGTK